jgi:Restriction endonuclease S subunits
LLEGLEVAEIFKSKISFENDVFRLDSQYFKKEYLKEDSNRGKFDNKYLGQIAFITDGQHGYHEVDENSPVRHLTAKNAKGWFANDIDADRIAKWVDDNNKRSSLKKDDLILSTRGTVGFCAIVDSDVLPSNIDQDVARIKIEKKSILPTVALTYLNSKVGQDWFERNQTGMVQQGIALWRVREIPLPIFSDNFQNVIDEIIKISKKHKNNSKQTYSIAETLLLETLGINDFTPNTNPVNVKSFKDSFLSTGRLDAEYYQKKYEEVVARIKNQKHERLANLVKIRKSIEPGSDVYSDEGLPFLRVADFNKFGLNEPEKKLSSLFCKENKGLLEKLKPKKETILFSKDGSVGTAYMLRADQNFITSGAILHLTVRDKEQILPEYLTLVLNSKLVQMQAERDAGGSIILHWRLDEIENVVVPVIDYSEQQKIAELVEESFKLKKQSDQLLETAKRAVEIAIEQDEKQAMEYISQRSEATEKK